MQAFQIRKNGKILDYRRSEPLNLDKVKIDFSKKFEVLDVRQPGRHVIITARKRGEECIIKLASSEGIGARTESERVWNEEYNKYSKSEEFRVPRNIGDGYYNNLYYLIIEKFEGEHLSTLRGGSNIIDSYIDKIVAFSEHIQKLPLNIPTNDLIEDQSHKSWFVKKTKSWLTTISPNVIREHRVDELFDFVEKGADLLSERPRHGDFTPWHMMALKNGGIGLIDGEHAHSHGVEFYDIAYFVQRVFSVIDRRDQAEKVIEKLKTNGVDIPRLKTVLISRAIGGFTDEYLSPVPDYKKAKEFSDYVLGLH